MRLIIALAWFVGAAIGLSGLRRRRTGASRTYYGLLVWSLAGLAIGFWNLFLWFTQ